MPMTITRMLATVAAVSLLPIGCGDLESTPDPEKPVVRSASPATARNKIVERLDPDGKVMHLTATDPEGKEFRASIGDEIDIPEEFPKDVPIFPGSTPMAFLYAPDEGIIVTFKSKEAQQDIFDFYRSSLADDGWEFLDDELDGNQLTFEAIKGDRKITVLVAGRKGDSRTSVIVSPND